MEKTFTIIAGVNGVGKSSFLGARTNLEQDELRIDVDKIAAENNISNIEAGKIALKKIDEAIKNGESFTQETTLSSHQIVQTIKKAKENGYNVNLYYIGVNSADEAIKRIANRVLKGGHDIPKEDVIRRYDKQKENIKKVLNLVDNIYFYDSENGFSWFALYSDGVANTMLNEKLKIAFNKELPRWYKEIFEINDQ